MKKIILTIFVFCGAVATAQVGIEKTTISGSGIMDFPTGTSKGLILPIVQALPATPANGTFLMDKNDGKIKMRQNNVWVDLSDAGSTSAVSFNSTAEIGQGVIIGATTSAASGVLVLEASDKALILPQVADPHTSVKSPYAGMMCYDTTSNSVAVFDGLKWSYWK